MMRVVFFIFILMLFYVNGFGQNRNDYGEMLKQADKILYNEPQEAIKITEHVAEKSEDKSQIVQGFLTTSISYYLKGDHENSVKAILQAKRLSEADNNVELQSKIGCYSVYLLYNLGLDVVAKEYLVLLKKKAKNINEKKNPWITIGENLIKGFENSAKNQNTKASQNFSKAGNLLKKTHDKTLLPLIETNQLELKLEELPADKAILYADQLLLDHRNSIFQKIILNRNLGVLYFVDKNYLKSTEHYNLALNLAEKWENNQYQAEIEDALASNYLATENTSQFQAKKKAAANLQSKADLDENGAVNSLYNDINNNHFNRLENAKNTFQTHLWILSGLILMVVLSYFALRWRYRSRAKQYLDFIRFFDQRQENLKETKKENVKISSIPKETELLILERLKQFEKSKQFTKQEMSLAQLATTFNTNTKYLSEIINTHKDKNFNAYINTLRINYIIDKLQNDRSYLQYKISYLAEESGFSSHSSFATVFKSITGMSPMVFIEILESKNKSSNLTEKIYEEVG